MWVVELGFVCLATILKLQRYITYTAMKAILYSHVDCHGSLKKMPVCTH